MFDERERRQFGWSVQWVRAVVVYEATGEIGRSFVLQGKDFGFYSGALETHWTCKAVTRADLHFKKIALAVVQGMDYKQARLQAMYSLDKR